MSSFTWSLGRYNYVSLVSPCAISASLYQNRIRRGLCCNCALSDSGVARNLNRPNGGSGRSGGRECVNESERSCRLVESVSSRAGEEFGNGVEGFEKRRVVQSVLSVVVAFAMTIGVQEAPSSRDTFEDVPQTLSGEDKRQRIQRPNSAKAENCTMKCVSTCIRGGAGSPGRVL